MGKENIPEPMFCNVSDYQRLFSLTYFKAKELDNELRIIIHEYMKVHPSKGIQKAALWEGYALGIETLIALIKEPKYRK